MSSAFPPGLDLATTPLGPPPPGVAPDFDAQDSAPSIRILCIVLLVLITLFTSARVYTRAAVLKSFGWDDAFLVLAWASVVVHMTFILLVLRDGFGRHIWNIPLSVAPELFKNFFVLEVFSCVVYLNLKLAFLVTYRRIFAPAAVYKWAINAGIVVVTLFYVGSFFWLIFKCQPIAKSWNPFLEGTCADEFVPGGETGIFNVISDVYILLLPIPMIWKLQTDVKRKVQLLTVFSVGLFATITSIIRLEQTITQAKNPDSTYALGQVIIWAVLEYSVGLMVVSTFVFTALWNQVLREPLVRCWSTLTSPLLSSRGDGNSSSGGSWSMRSGRAGKTAHGYGSYATATRVEGRDDARFEGASDLESASRSSAKREADRSWADEEDGTAPSLRGDARVVQRDWAAPTDQRITATTTTTVSVRTREPAEDDDDERHLFDGIPRGNSRTSTLVNQ